MASQPPQAQPARQPLALLPNAGTLLAAGVAFGAAAVAILNALGVENQTGLAVVSLAVVTSAAVLALVPACLLDRRRPDGAALGFMIGILVRLVLCGTAALAALRLFEEDGRIFCYWIAGWYMVLLLLELALVGRHVAKASGMAAGKNANVAEA